MLSPVLCEALSQCFYFIFLILTQTGTGFKPPEAADQHQAWLVSGLQMFLFTYSLYSVKPSLLCHYDISKSNYIEDGKRAGRANHFEPHIVIKHTAIFFSLLFTSEWISSF